MGLIKNQLQQRLESDQVFAEYYWQQQDQHDPESEPELPDIYTSHANRMNSHSEPPF